jgi:hypothetical protein
MKRHVAVALAVVTSGVVLDSHVDWVEMDGRSLLEVNGQHFDLRGWAADQALTWRRDCSALQALPADSPTALAVLPVIQQHSLPDSQSARWLQLYQWGAWSVAEVAFETLKPALVVLHWQGGQWRVQDKAVWSGSTAPWHNADFVRRYLRLQAPDLPQVLLHCVPIDPARYGPWPDALGPVALRAEQRP